MNRSTFLKYAVSGTVGACALGGAYSLFEAGWLKVATDRIAFPNLPAPFRGLRIALLTDFHHGPWISLNYIQDSVNQANALKPDVILLGGDLTHNGGRYIEPCIEVLSQLHAPMGVYAVLGNHDYFNSAILTRAALNKFNIHELNNSGIWLKKDGARLRLAGVDDYWQGQPALLPALNSSGAMPFDERAILLCHNPDYTALVTDPRVGLVLCGHTHGGQVVFPLVGAPVVPSVYGQKYLRGLIQNPTHQVFVSRGIGTITPPVRFCCRPEINIIELI